MHDENDEMDLDKTTQQTNIETNNDLPSTANGVLSQLPKDILDNILNRLRWPELVATRATCRFFRDTIDKQTVDARHDKNNLTSLFERAARKRIEGISLKTTHRLDLELELSVSRYFLEMLSNGQPLLVAGNYLKTFNIAKDQINPDKTFTSAMWCNVLLVISENIVAYDQDDSIEFLALDSGKTIKIKASHGIKCLATLPPNDGDGQFRWLASVGASGFVRVWKLNLATLFSEKTREILPDKMMPTPTNCKITALCFSSEDELVVGTDTGLIGFWDLSEKLISSDFKLYDNAIRTLRILPNKSLVSEALDCPIKISSLEREHDYELSSGAKEGVFHVLPSGRLLIADMNNKGYGSLKLMSPEYPDRFTVLKEYETTKALAFDPRTQQIIAVEIGFDRPYRLTLSTLCPAQKQEDKRILNAKREENVESNRCNMM